MSSSDNKPRRRARPGAHDSGVSLLAPTPRYERWRVVYVDPFTGLRPNRSFPEEERARIAFAEAVAYVTAAADAVTACAATTRINCRCRPKSGHRRDGRPTFPASSTPGT